MTVRLIIAAFTVLVVYGGTRWAKDRGMPTEPAPLEMKAQELPTEMGEWKIGEDVVEDKDITEAVGAEMVVNRQYHDRGGRTVSLHMAVFARAQKAQGVPHPPETCYPAGGWTIGDARFVSLGQGDATQDTAKFLPVERQGVKGYVLYWYQIDGTTYTNGDGQRKLLLACRGRPVFPPIVKVMLQTNSANPDDAEKSLKSLGGEVYKWSRGFH